MSDRAERETATLLRASRQVLARKGVSGLTVADVLDEAGLSTRAFYRHFASKDELVLAIYGTEQQRSLARMLDAVEAAADAQGAVVAWIDDTLALGFDGRRAARTRLLAAEGDRLRGEFPDQFEAILAAMLEPLIGAIRRGRDDGSFPNAAPERDARSIHAVVWDLVHQRLIGATPLTIDQARDHALRFCLGALGTSA